ncbi:ABC transporter ATP-binding protein [Micromonospora sp. NBC_01813]|uniref:ABC transporter ATP-binding protein n=1 Tax=Micromonospora sp. NBC_01813 TaxID=2975988 RepID=UPI002DD9CED8|nr:ABC transporter ATP-binding protein [Micromonospora sp. NBC_01813]WSA07956.1 ABC transporter ATP-binding protein/permease [Micromonospora sp. NBC_01813]
MGLATLVRLLATRARPYRNTVVAVIVLQALQAVALLYLPLLNADIIDHGVLKGDTGHIIRIGSLMIAVTVVQGLTTVYAVHLSARVAMAIGRDLREAVYQRVQRFSAQEMQRIGVPSLITRTSNDIQQVQTFLLSTLTLVVTAPVMGLGGFALAIAQDVTLALVLAALLPVLGLIVALLIRRMRPLSAIMQVRIDGVARVLREQIPGIRVTRAFARHDFEQARFAHANQELTDVSVRLGRVSTLLLPLVVNTVNVCGVFLVWIGGFRVESGAMQIGAFVALLTYLVMIQGAVLTAAFVAIGLPRTEVCAGRIDEVLWTRPSVVPPAEPVRTFSTPGHVLLDGVSFRYPSAEKDMLHNVDLVASPGTTTAIVGSTGSGKSTLVSLICRLFDPTGGRVLVGGEDVKTLDPGLLTTAIAVVPQQAHLFSGTVAYNLRYGRPDATDEELWRALDIAQARDFVSALDGKLEATIAQGGTNLSGGQRQRLAIARALVRRPQIYLFDDCFSALDHNTDAALRKALASQIADATTIIVAQRISTIAQVERIVVLDEGKVVGVGTHEELLRHSPVYQEIMQSQHGEAPQ